MGRLHTITINTDGNLQCQVQLLRKNLCTEVVFSPQTELRVNFFVAFFAVSVLLTRCRQKVRRLLFEWEFLASLALKQSKNWSGSGNFSPERRTAIQSRAA